MAEEVKLLPCPFCGGRANSPDRMGVNEWDVECYCGAGIIACGPNAGNREAAIAAWNARPLPNEGDGREALEKARAFIQDEHERRQDGGFAEDNEYVAAPLRVIEAIDAALSQPKGQSNG